MAGNLGCENYTYLISFKNECKDYVIKNKESLCSDNAVKQIYSDVCTPKASEVAGTVSVGNNPATAPYNLNLDGQTQTSLILFAILLVGALIAYFIYIFVRPIQDRKKQVNLIRIKFPNPDVQEEYRYLTAMQSFFNSIHRLIKDKRISFEIHKVEKRIELLISYTNRKVGESIRSYLTSIEGISIADMPIEDDPISKYNAWVSHRLVLVKDFYSINLEEKSFFKQVIDYLASLDEEDQAGVVITIRPTEKKTQIDKQLVNRDRQLDSNKSNLEVYKDEKTKFVK